MLRTLLALTLVAVPCAAQDRRGGGMEEFEEVDPYTKGDRALERQLGYAFVGSFPWHGTDRTEHVQQTMGGIPVLWVETPHFRIGSSLNTYEVPNDRAERDRIKLEIDRLKEKIGKFRGPRNELDPWLRLHLYAQRAEEAYASFLADFDLAPEDYSESGPYLGNPKKFLLLLCERKSELARYLRAYLDTGSEYSYRWGWADDCFFYGVNIEAIREGWDRPQEIPFDSVLHCQVVAGLAANFVDGYRGNLYAAPRWFGLVLGHVYSRRVDPRWTQSIGKKDGEARREGEEDWEPRVRGLVKNDFFVRTEDMFGWTTYEDLTTRDHLVAWSKLDFLLRAAEGDRSGFLAALCRPAKGGGQPTREKLVERQTRALAAAFELTPDELDEVWGRWVERTYRRR